MQGVLQCKDFCCHSSNSVSDQLVKKPILPNVVLAESVSRNKSQDKDLETEIVGGKVLTAEAINKE